MRLINYQILFEVIASWRYPESLEYAVVAAIGQALVGDLSRDNVVAKPIEVSLGLVLQPLQVLQNAVRKRVLHVVRYESLSQRRWYAHSLQCSSQRLQKKNQDLAIGNYWA